MAKKKNLGSRKFINVVIPINVSIAIGIIESAIKVNAKAIWMQDHVIHKDAGQKAESGARLYDLAMNAPDEVDVLRKKEWSFKKIFGGLSTKPISRD